MALIAYFPMFLGLYAALGSVSLAITFVPALIWAVALGPSRALLATLLLTIPNYFIFRALDAIRTGEENIQLAVSHLVIGFVCVIFGYSYSLRRDLSRELAEGKAKEAMFSGLFQATNDAVLISDVDSAMTILNANSEALRLLGYTREELLGKSYRSIVTPEEHKDLDTRLQQSKTSEWMPFYERTYVKKDGSRITVEINGALIRSDEGKPLHYQTISRDISARKAAQDRLYYDSTHDDLTGLYSRHMFFELIKRGIERTKRNKDKMAVLFLDLDGFKKINDTYGHATGDVLLKAVTGRLRALLREIDTLGRMGGDEFAVILEMLQSADYATEVAARIEQVLGQPFTLDGNEIKISASVGIAIYPDEAQDPDALLKLADKAMYEAKRAKYSAKLK